MFGGSRKDLPAAEVGRSTRESPTRAGVGDEVSTTYSAVWSRPNRRTCVLRVSKRLTRRASPLGDAATGTVRTLYGLHRTAGRFALV